MATTALVRDPRRKAWVRRRENPDTRADILREAAIAFARDGYEGTSLAAIAKEVGVTAPSVYNHFRSKNEILFTLLTEYAALVLETCKSTLPPAGTAPADRLRAFIRAYVTLDLENQAVVPIVNLYFQHGTGAERALTKPQRRRLTEQHRVFLHLMRGIVADGIADGVFSARYATVATFSVLGSMSNAVYWYRASGSLEAADIAAELANLAIASLGGPKA